MAGLVADREVLKASRSGEVFRCGLTVGEGVLDVVCKHDRETSIVRRMGWLFRGSPARRQVAMGVALLESGLRTPAPLVLLERGVLLGVRETWVIAETVREAVELDQVATVWLYELEAGVLRGVKNGLAGALAELTVGMSEGGFKHGDFKASNILVTDPGGDAGGPFPWLIDLEGVRRDGSEAVSRKMMWRAVVRLGASLARARSVTRTDRLRYLRGVLLRVEGGGGAGGDAVGDVGDWKARWRGLDAAIMEYNQKSSGRKSGKIDGFAGG